MRASRLLSILLLLQVRGRMSAAALAREFEVSVRTIYRDADQLSAAGVPVYAERGRAGGFTLLEGFDTRLTALTSPEAEALALSSVTQAAADLGLTAGASAARLKVLASLPRSAGSATRVAARFHLDPLPWYGRRAPPAALQEVAAAVWSDRRLRITYESWKGIVKRSVAPLGLVMKAGDWYLVGVAGRTTRTYRVDAIRALVVLDASEPRSTGFDLAEYWAQFARSFEERLASDAVRVRVTSTGLRLLRDFNPRAWDAVTQQAPTPSPDGWIEATIPFEGGPQAVREVLRMGADIEVLEPVALRVAVATEAARIGALHAHAAGANRRARATR
jgi:predicted DNA-binding transcriptional regulator YafY